MSLARDSGGEASTWEKDRQTEEGKGNQIGGRAHLRTAGTDGTTTWATLSGGPSITVRTCDHSATETETSGSVRVLKEEGPKQGGESG